MNDQKIEKVIFMGPPGVGKSTVIEQMVHTLMADTQGQIGIKLTTFDPAFQATLLAFPKRPLWGKYQWERINGSLYISSRKTKRKRTPERQTHPGREIEIVEVPFVGSRDNSNRGRSFVERVWIDAVAEDKQDAIVFVPFARVKPTVEKSIQLREEISHATTITDQLAILTKYGITFTAELLEKGKAKIEEAVRKLVAQIKNSASKKLLQIVEDDMRIMLRQELPEVPYEYLMRHIALPDGLSTSSYGYETRRDIFYWEMVLDGLGVPSSNRHIMINAPITSVQRRVLQKAA